MKIYTVTPEKRKPDVREIRRYIRAGKDTSDTLDAIIDRASERIYMSSVPRVCYTVLPLRLENGCDIYIGELYMQSKSLYKRLFGCFEACIFAASVGCEADRVIRADSASSALAGLCADAAGSAAIEDVCDDFCLYLSDESAKRDCITTERFSCGYGDLSIDHQKDIAEMLNTKKHIGATLSSGVMMTPTKTVTAIVGIKKTEKE